jgi:hypothetical protein
MIASYSSLVGTVIGLLCLGVYIFFLTPLQFKEVLRTDRMWLSRLRWIILSILVISIITAVPGLIYQIGRTFGHDYTVLRNIATILGSISKLGTTILMMLLYTYKQKE